MRAQSSTIGFIFVFALIALTIGSVTTFGFSSLEDAQAAERVENMERAFEVLDDNIEDLTNHGAPSRATEIQLAGGTVGLGSETTFTVNATEVGNPSNNVTFGAKSRPIVFTDADRDSEVVATFGALFRVEGGGEFVLSEPDWVVDEDRMLVPFVTTSLQRGPEAVGGETTILVVTVLDSRRVIDEFDPAGSDVEVNVTVESAFVDSWARYFESAGMTQLSGPTDADGDGLEAVTYTFTTERLAVSRSSINVRFE